MAPTPNREFLAEINKNRKNKFANVDQFLTNNGKLAKDSEGYAKRLARLQNFRQKSKREDIVLSGDLIAEARKIYGATADLYNIPELRSVMETAFVEDWTPEELLMQIDNTEWAKTRTAAQERYDVLVTTNPEQAQAEVAQGASSVRRVLAEKGIAASEEQIQAIAQKGVRSGWSSTQWDEYSASEAISMIGTQPAITTGTAAQTQAIGAPTATDLRTIAKNFGVPVAETTLNQWVQDIATNRRTADQFTEYARASAQTLYPSLADRLATSTFDEIVSPYKQLYANVLEVPEENIDLTDPVHANLFMAGDPTKPRMMTSTEWVASLRKKPEWQNTQNAYREYAQAADTLNKIFGGTR